jgi:hypothetical protein
MRMEASDKVARQFRQILLWPLQLMPLYEGEQIQKHWESLAQSEQNPWVEHADEFTGDPTQFKERHYNEFVTFLPYVQRFLYGQGVGALTRTGYGESPIRVFRRHDVARVRVTHGQEPIVFDVVHIDLYFFYDLDIAILVIEILGQDLSLDRVLDTLFRFGRAYPAYWDDDGQGAHCLGRVEWLSPEGEVLVVSDYEKREKYLHFVSQHRAPCIASHWEYLLRPMVLHHSDQKGLIRYRQIEHYRMPLMCYLAMEDPRSLTRGDFVRLALVTPPGDSAKLPYSERHLQDFEECYCYDRFWDEREDLGGPANTRFMCSRQGFFMIGQHGAPFFCGAETGLLGQFRHQYFLLCLIAHFQKAALLMLSDRLIVAVSKLDIASPDSVRQFKRNIRHTLEIFLRFSHRYWFHEVSEQAQAQALFRMWSEHLGNDQLFTELREEIKDMSDYLDADGFRRQANTVLRLTVVTTFGLIGTVATGFLGMNLIAEAEQPLLIKILYFFMVFVPVTVLTFYTLIKSKRLSDFLDALSDERLSAKGKFAAFLAIWRAAATR